MQATKLLQLKKATLNDIEIIQDICWMLSPNQIQKLLNQYLVADYEQPINGEIMKAVASRVTEKSDVLLLTAVDMEDSGPYEIAEPRVITALETYTPSCKPALSSSKQPHANNFPRAPNTAPQAPRRNRLAAGHCAAREDGIRAA
jgi:myosin-5